MDENVFDDVQVGRQQPQWEWEMGQEGDEGRRNGIDQLRKVGREKVTSITVRYKHKEYGVLPTK